MKIAILDNDIRVADSSNTTGVQTYAMHLKDGLLQLGHDVDIVGFTKKGKTSRAVSNGPEYKIGSIDDRREILSQYEGIIILIGFFKPVGGEYEFLRGLDKKYVVIEHSQNQSFEKHGYRDLLNVIGNVPVACNSISAKRAYKSNYNLDAVVTRQPFSRRLLPEKVPHVESDKIRILFPHRLIVCKKPEYVVNFLQNEIGDKLDWELHMYGTAASSTVYWTDLRFQLEIENKFTLHPFSDKRIFMHPPYNRSEIPQVFANGDITAISTKMKHDGARMEYTLLESIHYGVPIMSHACWSSDVLPEIQDSEAFSKYASYFPMTVRDLLDYATNPKMRGFLVEESNMIVDTYFDAKVVAQKFVDMLESQN